MCTLLVQQSHNEKNNFPSLYGNDMPHGNTSDTVNMVQHVLTIKTGH